MIEIKKCPNCGHETKNYKNPIPTVDIIIHNNDQIVLIERKNEPFGWALPGGFMDYGESAEMAAIREAKEETGLDVELDLMLNVYSNPNRDPRQHNISITFVAKAVDLNQIQAGDDAANVRWFHLNELPMDEIVFDHKNIIADFMQYLKDYEEA